MKRLFLILLLAMAWRSASASPHSVRLSWTLPATNGSWTTACGSGAGYDCVFKVYRASYSGGCEAFSLLASSAANSTSYVDTTVAASTTYCYYVTTTQSALGESVASTTVEPAVPGDATPQTPGLGTPILIVVTTGE